MITILAGDRVGSTVLMAAMLGGLSILASCATSSAEDALEKAKLPGSGIIPGDRLADWRAGVTVGVPGGIPNNRTNLIDVTKEPYNADDTGAADAQPAIMQAIAKAVDNDVVYLPPGKYRVDKAIAISKSNITLRGAGPDKTFVMAANSGRGGAIDVYFITSKGGWWDQNAPKLSITGSPVKGATVLTLADTKVLDALPAGGVGQMVKMAVKNDRKLPVIAPANYDYLRSHATRVVERNGNNVTISPPLLFDLPESLAPILKPVVGQIERVGVEDMTVDGTNSKTRHALVMVNQAHGCWLKNLAVVNVPNYHIWVNDSVQCEVRRCYVNKRNVPMGPDGAGIMSGGSSFLLVEDNLITEAFPHIEVNSTCGSVFAYNFCDDKGIQGDLLGGSINTNHGAHNSFNLYEGNVAPKLQCDGYHGSGSHDTLFRNWIHGTSEKCNQFWVCVNLNRFTRNYSIVGNVLGKKGHTWQYDSGDAAFNYGQHLIFAFGFPGMGNGGFNGTAQLSKGKAWVDWDKVVNCEAGKGPGPNGFQELDLDVKATTLLKGNFNYKDNGVPESESLGAEKLPPSLYLKEKPAFFGPLAWPAYGPDADPEKNKIPAQLAYEKNLPYYPPNPEDWNKAPKSAEPGPGASAPAPKPAVPAVDPAPHREALAKALRGESVKKGVKVFMNVMGKGQTVSLKGTDDNGLQVDVSGNTLPIRWKDVSAEDLAQISFRLLSDNGDALFHAGALALADGNATLEQKIADRLIELKSDKAKTLDAMRGVKP